MAEVGKNQYAAGPPVIDLSSIKNMRDSEFTADLPTVQEIAEACKVWGAFQVTNHNIPDELVARYYKFQELFFHLDKAQKRTVLRSENNSWGFFDEELTKQKVDWKEGFDFGVQDGVFDKVGLEGVNQWPDEDAIPSIAGFKATMREFYDAVERLGRTLTCVMTAGMGLPAETLVEKFYDNVHSSFVRMNYYPICPDPENNQGVGQHTDAGSLTVLTQSLVKSLQVYQPGDQTWYYVEPIEGAFVINTGDIMQVWSNGVYQACLHRVKANAQQERFSSPFFYNPSYATNYEPLESMVSEENPAQYRPINWGEFRMGRFAGDYADVGEEIQIEHFRIKN